MKSSVKNTKNQKKEGLTFRQKVKAVSIVTGIILCYGSAGAIDNGVNCSEVWWQFLIGVVLFGLPVLSILIKMFKEGE